jgi:hypothetical protein
MPQVENRYINREVDNRLQPSMDTRLRRRIWIRMDRVRNAIESRIHASIAGGQRTGTAFQLCGKIRERRSTDFSLWAK